MTEEELVASERRANDASPGPWRVYSCNGCDSVHVVDGPCLGPAHTVATMDDLALMSAAREDVPRLVAEVRRWRSVAHDLATYDERSSLWQAAAAEAEELESPR